MRHGFTLLEVLITLSLITIAYFFAIPSFNEQANQVQNKIAQTQLLQQLQHAQQIANSQIINVAVCLSQDGETCSESSGSSVLMFVKNQLIASVALKGRGVLHLRSYPEYRHYILVKPTVIATSDNGTFWYCSWRHILQWAIAVGQAGEAHIIAHHASENPLNC